MSEDKIDNKNTNKTSKESQKNLQDDQNIHTDGGDDQQLLERKEPVDFEGKDLDIPGRKFSGDKTKHQLKDEENQLYSQGGPENEDLEENK